MSIDRSELAEQGEELAWAVADALSQLEGTGGVSNLVMLTRLYREASALGEDPDLPPNPRFVQNGHSGRSPVSLKYMKSRAYKSFGSSFVAAGSGLASTVTHVDVFGAGQAANAIGSSSVHYVQLSAIAKKYKRSQTVTGWIDAVQKANLIKVGVRTADFVGAVVPSGAVGLATSITTACTRAGVKLTMGALIGRVAMEIHWRAKVEQALSGLGGRDHSGPNGPASAIMYEIFTRRGITRLLGKYDIKALISEPGGYLPLRDKMLLL